MSKTMYKKLKKQKGERFAQTIRNFHNGLLEIPDLDVIVRHAGREAEPLLPYLMSLLASNDDVPVDAPANPFDLLEQAGYDAFYADTLEKQNSIKGYFAKGELLCTFNDAARHKNFHIVHAVKKDVDKIKREDFVGKEEREDAYGTSVISIQMLKTGGFISIKNRYNHTVDGCDNTFKSNPDNIIKGLSQSLKDHFNVDFKANDTLSNEYHAVGRQLFKYNREQNGFYFGDQAWIKDGKIHEIDRSAGDALFDGFLFDNKTKTLKKIDPDNQDSFADTFNRYYGGNPALTVDKKGNLTLDGDVLIGAEESRIKTLYLPAVTEVEGRFLQDANGLTQVDMPSLKKMGSMCFVTAQHLKTIDMPILEEMGGFCLHRVGGLEEIDMPSLERMEEGCFFYAQHLRTIDMPALQGMGEGGFHSSYGLTQVDIPVLEFMGDRCFRNADRVAAIHTPALKEMGDSCFENAGALTQVDMPVLKLIKAACFSSTPNLKKVSMPALKETGIRCFQYAGRLETVFMPSLEKMGDDSFRNVENLTHVEMPALQSLSVVCFERAPAPIQDHIQKDVRKKVAAFKARHGFPSV